MHPTKKQVTLRSTTTSGVIVTFFIAFRGSAIENLSVQGTYFKNFHHITQYFLNLVLKRLCHNFISPVDMSADFVFMELCSVRFTFFLYCIVERIVMVLHLQTFISELMPLLTHTSLDPMSPPLSFPVLHSILEDFSTPLLSQCPASLHSLLLQIFSVSPRSLKFKPYKLFADTVLLF